MEAGELSIVDPADGGKESILMDVLVELCNGRMKTGNLLEALLARPVKRRGR